MSSHECNLKNFGPQCKTQGDIFRQWARVVDLAKAKGVHPEFKYKGLVHLVPRDFIYEPTTYEFPLAYIEDQWVYRRHVLWSKTDSVWVTVVGLYTMAESKEVYLECIHRPNFGEPQIKGILQIHSSNLSYKKPQEWVVTLNGRSVERPGIYAYTKPDSNRACRVIIQFSSQKARDTFIHALKESAE